MLGTANLVLRSTARCCHLENPNIISSLSDKFQNDSCNSLGVYRSNQISSRRPGQIL